MCKHMKKVRKTQSFPVSIVKFFKIFDDPPSKCLIFDRVLTYFLHENAPYLMLF